MAALIAIVGAVIVLLAVAAYLMLLGRRELDVRAAARRRRRLVEREQLLAELRLQQVMQDTVTRLFDAVRGPQ